MASGAGVAPYSTTPYSRMLHELYQDVFLKVSDASTYVFLCGANPSSGVSLRSLIHDKLKSEARVDVVFPEWLFASYLRNPSFDLIWLEQQLAGSVDFIVIPLESLGTIAELGAFASVQELHKKTLVLNDADYASSPSFINKGPIKAIKRSKKDNVIFYDKSDVARAVDRVVSRIVNVRRKERKQDISNLFTLAQFIVIVIALMQPVSERQLSHVLAHWNSQVPGDLVPACLATLLEKGHLYRTTETERFEDVYGVSQAGFEALHQGVLLDAGRAKVFAALRAEVIRARLRTTSRFNADKEWERLLEV